MIMTGDAVFCGANLDPDLPPGNAHTTEQAIASIAKVRLLTEFFGGEQVICHDPDFWSKWQPAPAPLYVTTTTRVASVVRPAPV